MSWISPQDLLSILESLRSSVFSVKNRQIWRLVPAAISCLWKEQDSHAFEDYSKLFFMVYKRAKELVLFWASRCNGART